MSKTKIAANLILTILLIGVIAVISINAFQFSFNTGTSNTVYGLSDVTVSGASVFASGENGSGSAVSDSQGNYKINSYLGTGDDYSVTASASGYVDQQVDNISVTSGVETTNVDIYMNVSGGINGTVTDAVTHSPLPNVEITASSPTSTVTIPDAYTDANGNYQIIQNLQPGTYNVSAETITGYIYATLTGIVVTAGAMTSGVNFALEPSGVITGTATNAVTHAALADIIVFGNTSLAITNSTGQYTLNSNMPTGTYSVTELFPTGYLTNTVNGIAVTAGETTVANIALDPSGVISGRVTNTTNGAPISGASIDAFSGSYGDFASTNSSGYYQMNTDLGTGTYTVEASYGSSFATNTTVNVVAGQVTPNTNFRLTVIIQPSGTISGTVTSSTGGPIAYADVTAQGLSGSESNSTDSNGNYVIETGLGTGTYNVTVTATGYASAEKTGVTVTVNVGTSGVNFVLTPVPSGSISGKVQSTQANPFPTPSPSPTAAPTAAPNVTPAPTAAPTAKPTAAPTTSPTASPKPTAKPTATPTIAPSSTPVSTSGIPQGYIYAIVVVVIIVVIIAAVLLLRMRGTGKNKV